jgi:hypothetical protein
VNIPVEMSLVDLVFHTFINCGRSAIVVKEAAIKPIIVMGFIMLLLL